MPESAGESNAGRGQMGIVRGFLLGQHATMPNAEPRVKVYGVMMTRRRYVVVQLIGFVWILLLYGFWRHAGLGASEYFFVRRLDALLLAAYLYGVAETVIVLRKFRRAANADKKPDA